MVVVSGLYQQYNGKETYFWQAQQLTDRDSDDQGAMIDAFLYVVSGIEDQKDAGAVNLKELEVPDRTVAFSGVYHKVIYQSSMSPQTANEGLYVTTRPRLGLAQAEKDLSLAHQAEEG